MNLLRRCLTAAVCIAAVMFAGCATMPRVTETRQPLSALCRQAGIDFVFDPVSLSAHLSQGNHRAHVLAGSSVVMVGAERVLLSMPVIFKDQELYVPEDFLERVLCRLDAALCVRRAAKSYVRIVIDPGHGGKDPGAVSRCGLYEKDVVLDISRRLERRLSSSGYDVKLTRATDVFLTLEERTRRTTDWDADIFISVHANASPSERAAGFEVWTARDLTVSDLMEAQREKNQSLFFSRKNMQRRNRFLEKTLEDMMYRHKHRQSLDLASAVSKNYVRSVGNRGLKESGFFVLKNTLVPSVLIEVGFLSNSREADRLRQTALRQEIADSIADGVIEYLRSL